MIRASLAGMGLLSYLDIDAVEQIFAIIPGVDRAKPVPGLNEFSFVDNGAQPIIAKATEAVESVRKAITVIDSEVSRFGLVLTYSKGRTEAFIVFYGKDSHDSRVNLLVNFRVLLFFVMS